ncbi:MAG: NAD(P)-dependent oxidoreductase [Bacteroidales bacterium]
MKIQIVTVKPFSKVAVDQIRTITKENGYELGVLEKYTDVSQIYEAVADADALIVRSDKVTKEVIEAAPKLKIVVRAGAGYDNLDLDACTAHNVVAMNTPGQNANAVAELALGFMIYMSRNQFTPGTGIELKDKTLGIQAYGNVGRRVANHAKGFGMNIIAFDPFIPKEKIESDGVEAVSTLEELYSKSDFLSIHIPATSQTIKSIGYDLFTKMPKGACFLNTARKEVIDEDGLMKALSEREDLKFIADIAPDNIAELREKFGTRVFATSKKMGAQTMEANINAGVAAINQICKFFKEGINRFQLNK